MCDCLEYGVSKLHMPVPAFENKVLFATLLEHSHLHACL